MYFQSVQILSFRVCRGGPKTILQSILKMILKASYSSHSNSHLFCTLISWKSRSWEIKVYFKPLKNFRSCRTEFFFSTPDFFSVCHLNFFQIYTINLKKSRWQTEKNSGVLKKNQVCRTWNFSKVWRPIKVQIKWPSVLSKNLWMPLQKEYQPIVIFFAWLRY